MAYIYNSYIKINFLSKTQEINKEFILIAKIILADKYDEDFKWTFKA